MSMKYQPPSPRLPVPLEGRYLDLSRQQARLLAELLAHPGAIISARLSRRDVTTLRSKLEPHGLLFYRVPTYHGYVLSREGNETHARLVPPDISTSSPHSRLAATPASRGISQGHLQSLPHLNVSGHRIHICESPPVLVIDEQVFVFPPLVFRFVLALFSAGPGQAVRRETLAPVPLRRQIVYVRRLLRDFGLDIVTIKNYGFLLVVQPHLAKSSSTVAVSNRSERTPPMASFNHCVFLGRIDRTPDLSRSSFGRLVARFPLVIEQDGTEILRLSIVARGNLAEIVTQNAHQGREVLVQGRLHLRHLTEEQTGVRHPLLDLVASTVLVLSDSACHAAQEASSEKNSHAFPTGGNEHA